MYSHFILGIVMVMASTVMTIFSLRYAKSKRAPKHLPHPAWVIIPSVSLGLLGAYLIAWASYLYYLCNHLLN